MKTVAQIGSMVRSLLGVGAVEIFELKELEAAGTNFVVVGCVS